MTMKFTLFIQAGQPAAAGWTEVYYGSQTDPLLAAQSFAAVALPLGTPTGLVEIRRGLMPSNTFIQRVRCSVEGDFRNEAAIDIPPVDGQGVLVKTKVAELWTSLLCRATAQAGGKTFNRSMFLGALPEDVVTPPDGFNFVPPFSTNFTSFVAQMVGGNWLMKSRPLPTAAAPILSFAVSADGLTALLTCNLIAAGVVGTRVPVILRGIKSPRGWNGAHTAFVESYVAPLATMTVGPRKRTGISVPPFVPGASGTVEFATYQYNTIKQFEAVRLTEHKRGRPFGEPLGRRTVY